MLAWSNLPELPLEEVLRQVAHLFLHGAARPAGLPRGEIIF
jgi:hypothetical protein